MPWLPLTAVTIFQSLDLAFCSSAWRGPGEAHHGLTGASPVLLLGPRWCRLGRCHNFHMASGCYCLKTTVLLGCFSPRHLTRERRLLSDFSCPCWQSRVAGFFSSKAGHTGQKETSELTTMSCLVSPGPQPVAPISTFQGLRGLVSHIKPRESGDRKNAFCPPRSRSAVTHLSPKESLL